MVAEPPAADDPFDLTRFVEAQAGGVFEAALAELEAGQKRSHWMWFIFPPASRPWTQPDRQILRAVRR